MESNRPLYTAEERARRDASSWTIVQGVLAPIQFLIFIVSLVLVVRYLTTGTGETVAAFSVLAKTVALYLIMITGSIWERVVFGKWLFADAFWWEDLVSMFVIALHTAYVVMWWRGVGSPVDQMIVALAGYATYVVNAGQFLIKFRVARHQTATQVMA
jgi:3-vinyl bacteriochlorophyllide hydratase